MAPAQDQSVWNQYYSQQQQQATGFAAVTAQPAFGAAVTQHYQTMPGALPTNVTQAAALQLHPGQIQPQQMQHQQQVAMNAQMAQPQQAGIGVNGIVVSCLVSFHVYKILFLE